MDCGDGDACTADGCTPKAGCVHGKIDCDDHLTCTSDSCDKTTGCSHVQNGTGKCCETDPDCDDANVCTDEHCVAGFCTSKGIANCCKGSGDCNDDNACTTDSCNIGTGACVNSVATGQGCCETDADCVDASACTLDRCVHNACAHEPTCCKKTSDCSSVSTAIDSCGEATCTSAGCGVLPVSGSGCCSPSVKSTGFEPKDAWSSTLTPSSIGQWSVENGLGSSKTGSGALVYKPVSGGILGGGGSAIARLGVVSLPAGDSVTLSFAYQSSLGSGETLRLRVLTGLGDWILWQASGKTFTWQTVSLNLSGFAGRSGTQSIKLQWEIVQIKNVAPTASVALDDVSLSSTCGKVTCKVDGDCNDGVSATSEKCGDGICVYTTAQEYCETSATCDDKDVCTADSCLPAKFACNHSAVFNCCKDNSTCDDKNVCTTDACSGFNQCQHFALPASSCCNSDFDCNDGNLCTVDQCPSVGLPCVHTQPDANCCISTANCNDGNKCTIDTCSSNQCSHDDVCCAKDSACSDGESTCTIDACVNQFCAHTPTGAPGCCVPTIFIQDMETALPAIWTTASSASTVTWHWSQKKAHGGSGSLWYGNDATGNYDAGGAANSGTLTSSTIDLPKDSTIEFSFWVWMDTEPSTYDDLSLTILVDGKTFSLWQKSQSFSFTMQTWTQVKIKLSAFHGKPAIFTFKFDTKDGISNSTQGVYLDDFSLMQSCAPASCSSLTDCDDDIATTIDGCAAGLCTWAY